MLTDWFPEITAEQRDQLDAFRALFQEWNQRINLVSRKDMDAFEGHHLVHSLALLKLTRFERGQRVLDVGTGGGLPGLPLAICCPNATFHLCDSVGKKIRAVEDMIQALGLKNVHAVCKRAETLESGWDFVLGRAVTSLPRFIGWTRKNIRPGGAVGFPNGIVYWKGTLYREELATIAVEPFRVLDLHEVLPDPYFEGKYIIHLARPSILHIGPEQEPRAKKKPGKAKPRK